jgi:hypothetical protein
MSFLNEVPPVETMHSTFMYLPRAFTTDEVYIASSLVGSMMRAWMCSASISMFSKIGMTKAAVFPVPFFALAMMLLPIKIYRIIDVDTGQG